MSKPRYTIGSVSGYSTDKDSRWATVWYVYDRLNGYAIVREFKSNKHTAEDKAKKLAAAMNAEHESGQAAFARCRHGHLLDALNLYVYPGGKRDCLRCIEERHQRRRARKAAA
jgi:hypothetical protein